VRGVGVEEDPEYKLIVEGNQVMVQIDNEIGAIHNFIRDKYRTKLPELESLVLHPIDYARVVKAIGNEMVSRKLLSRVLSGKGNLQPFVRKKAMPLFLTMGC
jgi:RNA processing factor Prp31